MSPNHLSKNEESLSTLWFFFFGLVVFCASFCVKESGKKTEKNHLPLQMSSKFHLKIA